MKHEKYSQNIYVYQERYLNEWNLKNFHVFKSDLRIQKLHKAFAARTDFPKVIVELVFEKVVCEFFELCKVFSNFC